MAVTNISAEVARVAEKARVTLRTAASETLQDIMLEVVKGTPVQTGFLRGSWWASLDEPVSEGKDARSVPASGAKFPPADSGTTEHIGVIMNEFTIGDQVFFTNNAVYARRIEFGDESRRPRRMVQNALADAPQIASETANRIQTLKGWK